MTRKGPGEHADAERRSRFKALIFAQREEPQEWLDRLVDAGCELSFGDPRWRNAGTDYEEDFRLAATGMDILVGTEVRNQPITRRIIEAAPDLRLIGKYGVGVDDIDTDFATERGILVCHGPTESNCFGVAESTMALMLAILKRVRERDRAVRQGKWRLPEHSAVYLGRRLSDGFQGITVGLVGFGRIGTRVADLLAPWRVRILACDPYIEPARFLLAGVERATYETILREADVVSFHCNYSKETHHMLSGPQLALMKPNAVVINTARGKIVDEVALAEALGADRIHAAALDATQVEPLTANSPLRAVPEDKILFSPHSAAFTEGAELRAGIEWAMRSVLLALRGELPDNVYNKDAIPRWQERFGAAAQAPVAPQ